MHHRIMVRSKGESTNEIARFGVLKLDIPAISNASASEKQTPAQSLRGLFTDDELKSRPKKDGQMRRAEFTEEQIIAGLKEHEAGAKTADLARMAQHAAFRKEAGAPWQSACERSRIPRPQARALPQNSPTVRPFRIAPRPLCFANTPQRGIDRLLRQIDFDHHTRADLPARQQVFANCLAFG